MEDKDKLVMREARFVRGKAEEGNRCTLKVDLYVRDMVAEVSVRTRKSMMSITNDMIEFAYNNIKWE